MLGYLNFNEANGQACVDVSLLDDDVLEGAEIFVVILNANNSTVSTPQPNASVVIQDDDCKY